MNVISFYAIHHLDNRKCDIQMGIIFVVRCFAILYLNITAEIILNRVPYILYVYCISNLIPNSICVDSISKSYKILYTPIYTTNIYIELEVHFLNG